MKYEKQAAHALGLAAEERCAAYLREKGYEVLALRLRTKAGEIDIVARHGDTLAIIEVKARASVDESLYSVTPAKQARLAGAAEALLADTSKIGGLSLNDTPNIRFDVMAFPPGGAPFHLEDAWRP